MANSVHLDQTVEQSDHGLYCMHRPVRSNIKFLYRISSVIRQFFFFLNNSKNLDLSYKTALDLRDCLGRVKLILWPDLIGLV